MCHARSLLSDTDPTTDEIVVFHHAQLREEALNEPLNSPRVLCDVLVGHDMSHSGSAVVTLQLAPI